jgi:hypothetical protein
LYGDCILKRENPANLAGIAGTTEKPRAEYLSEGTLFAERFDRQDVKDHIFRVTNALRAREKNHDAEDTTASRNPTPSRLQQRRRSGWFAKRPRGHQNFTQTSSSWINQVERFPSLAAFECRPGGHRAYQ